jgi:hypothetical protein
MVCLPGIQLPIFFKNLQFTKRRGEHRKIQTAYEDGVLHLVIPKKKTLMKMENNTPARFDGRPGEAEALTAELNAPVKR